MRQITRSVMYKCPGPKVKLVLVEHELKELNSVEILVKVSAAGLNRADLLQRQGIYKVPCGETEVPGVEIVGITMAIGADVKNIRVGDRVCGVVSGGGFSEYCILDSEMVVKVSDVWSDVEAAAFPEAALTANEALMQLGQTKPDDYVVVHAASSGMGTMLITMAKALGAKIICTTTSQNKTEFLYKLGADHVVVGEEQAFSQSVLNITHGEGAAVLIDFLGGSYFNSNIAALKSGGRLVVAGILDGFESKVNWIPLINKRISILPLTLRMKPLLEKRAVTQRFIDQWWDGCAYGPLRPVVHSIFPLSDLEGAQQTMLANKHVGKIVINFDLV
jgi:NADPH2:quinone reductase